MPRTGVVPPGAAASFPSVALPVSFGVTTSPLLLCRGAAAAGAATGGDAAVAAAVCTLIAGAAGAVLLGDTNDQRPNAIEGIRNCNVQTQRDAPSQTCGRETKTIRKCEHRQRLNSQKWEA